MMEWQLPFHERQVTFAQNMRGLVICLALILVTAWFSGGDYLLTRHLWMDEVHSWLIVTDADQSHAMAALADGVDFNPPAWFLVTRWLTAGAESATESGLRLLSMGWMLLALCGLYLMLSRHFAPGTCITAVLFTASHPLLIHQSTEIRFYGFWFACAVWLCHIIQLRPDGVAMRRLQVTSVSALALLTTTCHYFGILSLSLAVLPLVFRRTRDRVGFRLAIIAAVSGVAGLANCANFLVSQKAALSRPTWISPATAADSLMFLMALVPGWQILACAAGMITSAAFAKRFVSGGSTKKKFQPGIVCLLPCLCLAAMPLVIVLVAWCIQPALVTRYAMVGLAGFAPMFAIVLAQSSKNVQKTLTIVSLLGLGYNVGTCADQWIGDDAERSGLVRKLEQCPTDAIIVFEDRIRWMPVVHQHPEFMSRCRLAEFSDDEMAEDSTLRVVQRDVGRRIQRWYPQFSMVPIKSLAGERRYFVVPYAGGSAADLAYPPGYFTTQDSAGLVCFQRAELTAIGHDSTTSTPEDRPDETRATSSNQGKLLKCF